MKKVVSELVLIGVLLAGALCGCLNSGGSSPSNLGAAVTQNPGDNSSPSGSNLDKTYLDATSDGGTLTFQNIGAAGMVSQRKRPCRRALRRIQQRLLLHGKARDNERQSHALE